MRKVLGPGSCVIAALAVVVACGDDGGNGSPDAGGGGAGASGAAGTSPPVADATASGSSAAGDASVAGQAGRESAQVGSGRLWVVTNSSLWLKAFDTATAEEVVAVEVAQGSTDIYAMALGEDRVWLIRTDGVLVAVDAASQQVETLSIEEGEPLEHIAVGGGYAYVALKSQIDPVVVQIDVATLTEVRRAPVIEATDDFEGLLLDGDTLWVLAGNGFSVIKADAETLEVEARVPLGQSPDGPNAPRGDYYGFGFMTQSRDKLWVVDSTNAQLLSVDKVSLEVTMQQYVPQAWLDDFALIAARGQSLFFGFEALGSVVRLNDSNGAGVQTYPLEEGGGGYLALTDSHLYTTLNTGRGDVVAIDIESGAVTRTFEYARPSALAVEP